MTNTHRSTHISVVLITTVALCALSSFAVNADWTGDVRGEQVLDGDNKGSRIRFEMSNDDRPFGQSIYADYINLNDSGSGFGIGYEPRFWFTDKFYVFGTGSAQTSGSDAIDYTRTIGAGLGAELINTDFQELSATIGASQIATVFDDDFVIVGEDSTTTAVTSYVTLSGEQQISDYFKLGLSLGYSAGEFSDVSSATASIKFRVPGGSAVYNYSIQNIDPDVGESTESKGSSISFEYGF